MQTDIRSQPECIFCCFRIFSVSYYLSIKLLLDDAYCGTGLFSAFGSVQETIEKLSPEELHCAWLLFVPPVFVWALLFAVPVARIGKEACSHR